MNHLEPPSGSRISVTTDGTHPLIVIPNGSGGLARYFLGVFLLAWLGAWFVGFGSAFSTLSSGKASGTAYAFLVFWLVAWTLGGGMAVLSAYRAFRPSVPESLRLMPKSVMYDSGVPPLRDLFRLHITQGCVEIHVSETDARGARSA